MDPYIVTFYLGFGICVIGLATRRPVATTVFLIGTAVTLWLGIGATLPIDKSLTLCLFKKIIN